MKRMTKLERLARVLKARSTRIINRAIKSGWGFSTAYNQASAFIEAARLAREMDKGGKGR